MPGRDGKHHAIAKPHKTGNVDAPAQLNGGILFDVARTNFRQ
jgi:hypothetical protein